MRVPFMRGVCFLEGYTLSSPRHEAGCFPYWCRKRLLMVKCQWMSIVRCLIVTKTLNKSTASEWHIIHKTSNFPIIHRFHAVMLHRPKHGPLPVFWQTYVFEVANSRFFKIISRWCQWTKTIQGGRCHVFTNCGIWFHPWCSSCLSIFNLFCGVELTNPCSSPRFLMWCSFGFSFQRWI